MLGKRHEESTAERKCDEQRQRAVGHEVVAGLPVAVEEDRRTASGIQLFSGGYEAPFLGVFCFAVSGRTRRARKRARPARTCSSRAVRARLYRASAARISGSSAGRSVTILVLPSTFKDSAGVSCSVPRAQWQPSLPHFRFSVMTEPRNSNAMSRVSSPVSIASPSRKLYAVITNRFFVGGTPPCSYWGSILMAFVSREETPPQPRELVMQNLGS